MKKDSNKKFLQDVSPELCFWCHDGKIFKNLSELEKGLKNMSLSTYDYHVFSQKNDFGKWVEEVIGDTELANKLRKSKSKGGALKRVSSRLNLLNKTSTKKVLKKRSLK